MVRIQVSFVIPNWNGEFFLTRCLSSILHSAGRAHVEFEIVAVDDASTDGGCRKLEAKFPGVRLVRNEINRGFIFTANRGVELAQAPLVILLNNDVVLMPDFVANILRHFEGRDELFGVSALTVEWETHRPNHAWVCGTLNGGAFELRWEHPDAVCPAMFMQGGACAFRRARFLELGGFDPIFSPGYWEDYDLSLRALSRGWRILYEPQAAAYHIGKASFTARHGADAVNQLDWRNRFLFCWMNLEGFAPLRVLPGQLARELWRGNTAQFKAFLKAFRLRAAAARGRALRSSERVVPQEKIFAPFAGKGRSDVR